MRILTGSPKAKAAQVGWNLVLLVACLSTLPSTADAATITHEKLDATTEIIGIDGDIASGDLEQFRKISLRYPKAVVVLNSRGGLIQPAIEIGKIIRITGYATVVYDNGVCASACALIWMAGSKRLLSSSGHIGFHASYRDDNGKAVESGVANALVGNYLTLLGASAKTIVFATTAPPERVLWLTAANKESAGIDFENITPNRQLATNSVQTPQSVAVAAPPPTPVALPRPPRVSPLPARFPARLSANGENWIKYLSNAYYDSSSLGVSQAYSKPVRLSMWVIIDFTEFKIPSDRYDFEYIKGYHGKKVKIFYKSDYIITKLTLNCESNSFVYNNSRKFHDETQQFDWNQMGMPHLGVAEFSDRDGKETQVSPDSVEKAIFKKLCER